MRTLIIVIIIILLIIVGWFFVYTVIENNTNAFIHSLNIIAENVETKNWQDASVNFINVKEKWMKERKFMTIFLDHHEVDNIDLAIARTEKYIKGQDLALSLAEIDVLKKLFSIVKENESVTLENIL
ncbi:DUF4363 family protein [Clostridiaceae bacterium 35-E11]